MRHPTISDAPPRTPAPPNTEDGGGGDDRAWEELADVLAEHLEFPSVSAPAIFLVYPMIEAWAERHDIEPDALRDLADQIEAAIQEGYTP